MDLIFKAIEFSARAHDRQYRKSTKTPYISHPYAVGMLLLKAGCSDDIILGGILHDVIEDTDVSYNDLVDHFGKSIADIVNGCSEPDKSLEWEERKQHTIDYLKNAPTGVKLVACADKLHNLTSIEQSLKVDGLKAWDRFNRGKDQQEWYYRSLVKSISNSLSEHVELVEQLEEKVNFVFEKIGK